jgi:hypothetical protein
MADAWLTVLALSLGTTAISATVSKAKISKPFRDFLLRWSQTRISSVGTPLDGIKWRVWVWELFSCAYCLSHWVAGVLVAIYRPDVLPGGVIGLDEVLSVFVIVTVANVVQNHIMPNKR